MIDLKHQKQGALPPREELRKLFAGVVWHAPVLSHRDIYGGYYTGSIIRDIFSFFAGFGLHFGTPALCLVYDRTYVAIEYITEWESHYRLQLRPLTPERTWKKATDGLNTFFLDPNYLAYLKRPIFKD